MAIKKLFVGNLSYSTTESGLMLAFADFQPQTARIIPNRGFGFVEVPDDQMDPAIAALDGTKLDGRQIQVNEARPREDRPQGDRGGGGGGYGGGGGGGYGGGGGGGKKPFDRNRSGGGGGGRSRY